MKYSRALPLVLLFGSVTFSQTPAKQFSSQILQANCPVELRATQDIAAKTTPAVPVGNAPDKENDQRLRITLRNPKSEIVVAQITVQGFPVGGKVIPALIYFPNDPNQIKKRILFDRKVRVGGAASIEVPLRDFGAVTSIDLNSVTYADGSDWRPENHKYCRAIGLTIDAEANIPSR